MISATFECDFTLALNNATGKFFFCKELLESCPELVERTWYWRVPLRQTPKGLVARVLGRLSLIEVSLRVFYHKAVVFFPQIVRSRPVIFTDPRECVLYKLKRTDVVLCHDLGPITHPELYDPPTYALYKIAYDSIRAARLHMLFVSDASKRAFVNLYGDDYALLRVVHIPLRQGIAEGARRLVEGVPAKFLLTVGSIGARKNQARSIEAFVRSGLRGDGYNYVICGGLEPGAEAVMAVARKTPGVITTGYVDDDQLRWLYANACGFVLPSLLEGFGLPTAEAIAHGLVPLIGPDGALHEVAGTGAVLADPMDVNAIARGMRALASMDEADRGSRLAALRASIERFSHATTMSAWREALSTALSQAAIKSPLVETNVDRQ